MRSEFQPHLITASRRASIVAEFGETALRDRPCFRLENGSKAEPAKIYVYDEIGGYDSDASEFVQQVHAIKSSQIDMHINSPGGYVFDAVAMFEALQSHPAKVITYVDGLAASAASFLAMAGDEIEIAKGGRMMIHDALGVAIGNASEMREYADLLDTVSDDISGYYSEKAGGKPSDWRTAMKSTSWYSASQAVDAGLADRVTGGSTDKPKNVLRSQLIRARAHVTLRG